MLFVGPADREVELRDLVAARARWNANGVSDYDVTAQPQCFCRFTGPARIVVRGGVVVRGTLIATGQPLDSVSLSGYRSVERLFDVLEDAVRTHAHRIDASYNSQYGFPQHFFIDYSQMTADEEYGYQLDDFTPLGR